MITIVHPKRIRTEDKECPNILYLCEGKVRMMEIHLYHPSAPAGSNTPTFGELAKKNPGHVP